MIYDLAVIGAGPAGMSAAIYASRGQLKTIMFGDYTKSNLYKSHIIANYFGFPDSPTGPELAEIGLKHALSFGAENSTNQILDIQIDSDQSFILKDNQKNTYQAKTIILATGQSYVLSGIKGEQELIGKGVSYCVVCDGFFFKNKTVCVIGNGDYAAEEALELLPFTKSISILSHGKDFTISDHFIKELQQNNIQLIKTPRLLQITGTDQVEGLSSSDGKHYSFDGIFMAIGIAGANAFAKKLGLEMTGNYLKVDRNAATNIPGVFAAGDCTGDPPQVATSVGNGCIAALSAIKLVQGLQTYIQYN